MTYVIPVVVVAIIGGIVFSLRRKGKYYDEIFSDDHYAEIVNWLRSVLKLGPVADPEPENNTAFQTSAGCGLTFTREIGEKDIVHIAISQVGHVTTHAVCNRIAFLIAQALTSNDAEGDFLYTESNIHHILFVKDAGDEWDTKETDIVIAEMKFYEPPPFQFQSLRDSS
ncbi:hypothetical protein IAD21_04776 [Abditibacteriota bacterium]|nr:hypothetical protein IAD21_04776 [Abditibacteriota bacterium]